MTTHSRPFALSAACLATAVTLTMATPTVADTHHSIALATPTVTSSYELLADSQASREVGYGDWAGLFAGFGEILGGLGQMGNNYLDANQASVLAFTAKLPTLMLGPVAIGGGRLANAYYFGYNGSPTGNAGVGAYIISQLTTNLSLTNLVKNFVLGLTGIIPKFYLGPVQVGGGLLADAWFNGYGGATGPGGVFNYITSAFNPAASAVKPAAAAEASLAVAAPEAAKPTGHSAREALTIPVPHAARAAAAAAPSAHKAAAAATAHAAITHGGSKRPAA
ncbi:hypothetical protein [Mycobacterium sp. DL592]|uniref:hypothetical protein n=1 Tax=Mycobacterium sp. DL592 TaxID=2675524 RepID=UPI00142446A7|nr:hypothetical protein [Mycobacterium sp. DL592]